MPVIQSYSGLQGTTRSYGGGAEVSAYRTAYDIAGAATYAQMYSTQPYVRTVVDYIARTAAQVALHVFRLISDTDRERLRDHELADWLEHPNPYTTGYTLKENLFQDMGIYGAAYWLKVRKRDRLGLVRLPPETVTPIGWLLPAGYLWTPPDGATRELRVKDLVVFKYFNPTDPLCPLPPLETLRGLLAEDAAARGYRRTYYQNAARQEGVVERPAVAPKWTTEQKTLFREQWRSQFSGKPGQVVVLDEGMTYKPTTYSAQQSEFTAVRKLTREEVTAMYHCPLPMVGILEHATFSNIKEQHKHLYQDCMGPAFEWLQQEIERQLLPECDDQRKVYVEANVADKLKGSFEEQAAAMQTAVGRPWMTVNEARARQNLSSIKDDPTCDQIALSPGVAAAGAETPPVEGAQPVEGEAPVPPAKKPVPAKAAEGLAPVIRATWQRQAAALEKLPRWEHAIAFDPARWNHELATDLTRAGLEAEAAALLASTVNADTVHLLFTGESAFSEAREAALYG